MCRKALQWEKFWCQVLFHLMQNRTMTPLLRPLFLCNLSAVLSCWPSSPLKFPSWACECHIETDTVLQKGQIYGRRGNHSQKLPISLLYIFLVHKIHFLEWYISEKILRSLILSFHTNDAWCPATTSHDTNLPASLERKSQRFGKHSFIFLHPKTTKVLLLTLKSFLTVKFTQLWFSFYSP